MLVDYEQSPVGPYQELLFIPGRFQFGRRRYYMVTQIYVSTQVSVENGQENWGIPKQLAQFHFETVDERVKQFTVGSKRSALLPCGNPGGHSALSRSTRGSIRFQRGCCSSDTAMDNC
jgi:acetoacetate decarboxylase